MRTSNGQKSFNGHRDDDENRTAKTQSEGQDRFL